MLCRTTLRRSSVEERRQAAVNISDYLQPASRLSRYSHELAYHIPSASADYVKFSFFPRTASDCNMWSSHVVTAPSLDAFRARLGRQTSAMAVY